MITEEPFGVYPYLWVSQEMLVTPGRRKSKGGKSNLIREEEKDYLVRAMCNVHLGRIFFS